MLYIFLPYSEISPCQNKPCANGSKCIPRIIKGYTVVTLIMQIIRDNINICNTHLFNIVQFIFVYKEVCIKDLHGALKEKHFIVNANLVLMENIAIME